MKHLCVIAAKTLVFATDAFADDDRAREVGAAVDGGLRYACELSPTESRAGRSDHHLVISERREYEINRRTGERVFGLVEPSRRLDNDRYIDSADINTRMKTRKSGVKVTQRDMGAGFALRFLVAHAVRLKAEERR